MHTWRGNHPVIYQNKLLKSKYEITRVSPRFSLPLVSVEAESVSFEFLKISIATNAFFNFAHGISDLIFSHILVELL